MLMACLGHHRLRRNPPALGDRAPTRIRLLVAAHGRIMVSRRAPAPAGSALLRMLSPVQSPVEAAPSGGPGPLLGLVSTTSGVDLEAEIAQLLAPLLGGVGSGGGLGKSRWRYTDRNV